MLDERHLVLGLDALCRAHETDFFVDGHRGAAVLAAYFLSQEPGMERGIAPVMADMIDRDYAHLPLFAPFQADEPAPAQVPELRRVVEEHAVGLRMAGHNVIFPSLALRAFQHAPALATPTRLKGLCQLVRCFKNATGVRPEARGNIPRRIGTNLWADFVLKEMLRSFTAFEGRGQGWSGHWLTFSRALADLRACGHASTAAIAENAWRCYLHRLRCGPGPEDRPQPEHVASSMLPHSLEYWRSKAGQRLGLGHVFKYAYAFHGLCQLSMDRDLTSRAQAQAWRVL